MKQRLKFLLSGPGLIGKVHARLLSERNDTEIAAIVAPITTENKAFAENYGAPLFSSIAEAVKHTDIDAAIISSPNEFHYEQTSTCIEHGIPVLVEKPITSDLDSAKMLADIATRSGVPVLVGHHRSHSTHLKTLNSFLNSKQFGKLVTVHGSALFLKPRHYFLEGKWRTLKGGGPILINLIHEVNFLRQTCGEIASIFAFASHNIRNFEVEDTVSINLEFHSGALGTFVLSDAAASSKSWEMTSGENPAYPHFPKENCYHFSGTRGSLDFPSMEVRYYPSAENSSWWQPFQQEKLSAIRCDPLEGQLTHFVDVVRTGAAPEISPLDGFRNMEVIEAIRKSIQTRAVVEL